MSDLGFDPAELQAMRETGDGLLLDRIVIVRYRGMGEDAHGKRTPTYAAETDETACSWQDVGTREIWADAAQQILADAMIRVTLGTALGRLDRVRLVKRFGETVLPQDYNIAGAAIVGSTAKRYKLTKV